MPLAGRHVPRIPEEEKPTSTAAFPWVPVVNRPSVDSVAAAVAVSDRLWLVMAGGVIGVIALRLTAELFIRWLEVYQHLETAGYLAVGLVGIRLLLRLGVPQVVPPEWLLLVLVAARLPRTPLQQRMDQVIQ